MERELVQLCPLAYSQPSLSIGVASLGRMCGVCVCARARVRACV